MAAATLFGPVVAGALVERYGWGVMTAAMGVFAFSGAIPAVSRPVLPVRSFVLYDYVARHLLTWRTVFLYRWVDVRKRILVIASKWPTDTTVKEAEVRMEK